MRKNLIVTYLYTFLALVAISCSKEPLSRIETMEYSKPNEAITKSVDSLSPDSQIPLDYFSRMSFKEWTNITNLDNRFDACNVSKEVLDTKTTDALAKSLIHYPLNYLVLFYNEPQEAIRQVMDHSRLHQEYVKRPDAAQVITQLFSNLTLDMSIENSSLDDSFEEISYANELFLEYFIGSGVIPGIFTCESSVALEQAANTKLSQRELEKDTFSYTSKYPLIHILDRITEEKENHVSTLDSSQSRSSVVTIKTFFKQPLTGYNLDEMSGPEMVNATNEALTQHPNAILRGPATRLYNCHSYAWHDSSVTNNVWLVASYNNILQLSKYWTNDLFVSCSQSSAEKVYYSSGDHSAIVLSNGKYLSKWGKGPLMEHDYDDCPYNTSNLQYYVERTTPVYGFTTISGDSFVYTGQSNTYSFDADYDLSFSVHMQYMELDYPLPCTLSQVSPGTYSLVCDDPGYYVMILEGFRNGNCVARATKGIVAYGSDWRARDGF